MNLKSAASVCLISLFSATLVVLLARSLDSQAASQLEPQLTAIAEELQAIRKQGGIVAASGDAGAVETVNDGLVVYYFHGNIRCPTCRSIESQAQETVQTHFAKQLSNGEVVWKIVNYEQAAARPLAEKFQIQMPVVVLAKMKDGKIENWKRLDKVWAVVGDKPAFAKYVREEIERMLTSDKKPTPATTQTSGPTIPIPTPKACRQKMRPRYRFHNRNRVFQPHHEETEVMRRVANANIAFGVVALCGLALSQTAPAADDPVRAAAPADRVVVMYFHRTQRCPTCRRMGSYSEEAVTEGFAKEIKDRTVEFHYVDFQDETNAALTKGYKIGGPTLIVAQVVGNKVKAYKNLTEIWTKNGDKDAFLKYVRDNVAAYQKQKPKTAMKPAVNRPAPKAE